MTAVAAPPPVSAGSVVGQGSKHLPPSSPPQLLLPTLLLPPPSAPSSSRAPRQPMSVLLSQHRSSTPNSARSDCDAPLLPPVPEERLVRDCLYLFQGIDGEFVRFRDARPRSPGPHRTFLRGEIAVHGPAATDAIEDAEEEEGKFEQGIEWVLAGTGMSVPATQRALVHSLSEVGWLFRKVQRVLSRAEGDKKGKAREGRGGGGMVEQSLGAEVRREMTEYFRLVARLEAKLEGVQQEEEGDEDGEGLGEGLTLRKLDVWTRDVRLRMRMMATLVSDIAGRSSSGSETSPLSHLHAYTTHGDPFISQFSSHLLSTLSTPFFTTLRAWIYAGELQDPHGEFFVVPASKAEGEGEGGEVASHELWKGKFVFREEVVPSFLGEAVARKIFSTGKSLNFMKYSCDDAAWVMERSHADQPVLRYTDMSSLEHSISLAYIAASRRVFELFFDKFRLMDHLQALKDYLLFGKGDFVEILIEQLGPSLKRPANTLYRHNVTSALESAIRGSTPPGSAALSNVLQRLDARVLDSEQGLIGWDVFLLEYKVDAPLSTILDPASLDDYRALFKHLWMIKRVEYTLNECWRTLMTKMRLLKKGSDLAFVLHQTRITLSEMIFFVRQVESFCHLEVIACQWSDLEDFIAKKEGDLDKLVDAHRRFLGKLVEKALLKPQGRRKKETKPLIDQLRDVFRVMLVHVAAAEDLYAFSMQYESYARAAASTARGQPPLAIQRPTTAQLENLEERLASSGAAFREQAKDLVVALDRSPDLDLRFLAVRLNFNYQFRPDPSSTRSEV
uniref:BY PROTMAP: gi/472586515/gb/EMS24034.1/ spindle pole body component Alp6 [Rhodosporidium toruloides NP11] gi/647397918/emb/CDR41343.1/ RHTO0S06e00936g1_1 [Rhodosporidium toruloides] n=2 Tax=Rhodotorula toruloides TaxID=5286 RepID=A0A0K3C825_RHOTO